MLLGIDTATPWVSVAVHADGGAGGDVVAEVAGDERMRHGEQLAPAIERALAQAGADRRDLTAIAVGVGPGPFTGLRVGVVTARVMAHVLDIPAYGVCSLDVLAVEAVATGAVEGPFVVASDARRKEVHVATYDERATRLEGPVVAKPDTVATALPVVGEGALLYPEWLPRAVGPTRVSAGWLTRTVAGEHAELLDPEPLYLRRPDAVEHLSSKRVT